MNSRNVEKIKFKWKSFRSIYSLILLLNVVLASVLNGYKHSISGPIKPSNLNGVVFYLSSAISCILFHQIDWKGFMIEWNQKENSFISEKYKHPPSTWTLKRKIHFCTTLYFMASLLNQVCFVAAEGQKVLANNCSWTNENFFKDFVTEHLDHIFKVVPYNHVLAILAELGNCTIAFYWSFPDLFIMLVSIGISYRFKQINKRIDYLRGRVITNDRWNELRLDYVENCELLKFVDGVMSKIILLASMNNSYLILVQLLNILAWDEFLVLSPATERISFFLFSVGSLC